MLTKHHIPRPNDLHNKIPNFIFLVPFADTISIDPSPESLQCHLEYGLKKVIRPKIKIPLVK